MDGSASQDNLGLKILKKYYYNNLINLNKEYSIKYSVQYGIAVSQQCRQH